MPETPEELMAKGNELLSRARGYAFDWASEAVHRMSPEARVAAKRRSERRMAALARIAKRVAAAVVAILIASVGYSVVVGPLGLGGLMLMVVAMIVAAFAIVALSSKAGQVEPERFAKSDIAQLPAQTEAWLERQRPALPAPAQRQLDGIGIGLEQLGRQVAGLDAREPAAIEVRRLIGEELPELVRGYARVPEQLRRQPLNGGPSPDAQVADGLATIRQEIDRMNANLATGELHALATQQRYLELKYKGDGPAG
jgi:hypothetical protein